MLKQNFDLGNVNKKVNLGNAKTNFDLGIVNKLINLGKANTKL